MPFTSHVPQDPGKLIPFLDQIESEADEALGTLPTQWKQSACLYKIGAPEPYGENPPLFAANLIQPATRRGAALLAEQKPRLDVKPRRDGLLQTSHVLRATIEAGWDEQSVGLQIEDLLLLVRVFNSGFMKITWDADANYGLGDIAISTLDPRQVKVDAATRRARDLDGAQYLIDRSIWPLSTVAMHYPDIAAQLKPCGKISAIDEQQRRTGIGIGARIKGIYKRVNTATTNSEGIPRCELKTYWVVDPAQNDDDQPMYPNGRLIVRANDDVICEPDPEKQQNPYYHGRWPYEWLDGIPDFDSPWGIADTEAIKRIQETFNRVGNAAAQAIIRESRSWVIYDEGAIQNEDADPFVQLGFRTIGKRRQYDFRHEPSPVSVASYAQWMGLCQNLIDYLEGLQDGGGPVSGKGRVEVRSAGLLEGLQQAQQVLIRSEARRLEGFLERLGQKWIALIFQFYTTDRLMTFIGANGKWNDFKFERAKIQSEIMKMALTRVREEFTRKQAEEREAATPENVLTLPPTNLSTDEILKAMKGAWRDFRFKVEPFSSLSSTRQQRAAMLMQLNGQAMAPAWMAMEELGYDNPKELVAEAVEEAKERAAMGIPALAAQSQPKKKQGGGQKGQGR